MFRGTSNDYIVLQCSIDVTYRMGTDNIIKDCVMIKTMILAFEDQHFELMIFYISNQVFSLIFSSWTLQITFQMRNSAINGN